MTYHPITDSPSGAFHRGQFGASEQISCEASPDGLGHAIPANENAPTRGGEASASSFRPVGLYAEQIVLRLERDLQDRAIGLNLPDDRRSGDT